MFVVFIALIVGPAVAGDKVPMDQLTKQLSFGDMRLVQPLDKDRKYTNGTSLTGTGGASYSGVFRFASESASDGGGRATDRIRLF